MHKKAIPISHRMKLAQKKMYWKNSRIRAKVFSKIFEQPIVSIYFSECVFVYSLLLVSSTCLQQSIKFDPTQLTLILLHKGEPISSSSGLTQQLVFLAMIKKLK